MANKIIHKRSAVPGRVPDALEFGELALNYSDGKIYYKNSQGIITEFSSAQENNSYSDRLVNGTKTFLLQSDGSVKLSSEVASLSDGFQQLSGVQAQAIDIFSIGKYRAVKYTIQAIAGPHSHSTEVLLTHNDVGVFLTEYGTVFSDFNLITVDADIESGNVVLKIIPMFSETTISFYKTGMSAGTLSGGVLIEGDLMLQTGTVDLMQDQGTFDLQV